MIFFLSLAIILESRIPCWVAAALHNLGVPNGNGFTPTAMGRPRPCWCWGESLANGDTGIKAVAVAHMLNAARIRQFENILVSRISFWRQVLRYMYVNKSYSTQAGSLGTSREASLMPTVPTDSDAVFPQARMDRLFWGSQSVCASLPDTKGHKPRAQRTHVLERIRAKIDIAWIPVEFSSVEKFLSHGTEVVVACQTCVQTLVAHTNKSPLFTNLS